MSTTRKQFLKQAGFALAGSMLPYSKMLGNKFLHPLTLDERHPKTCTNNLKANYYDETQIMHDDPNDIFYYYKTPDTIRDVLYKDDPGLACFDSTVISDSCSNTNKQPPADSSSLKYKVSYPKNTVHNYTTTPLPVIFLFHAGGYKECSHYDDDFMTLLCKEYARKGFICCTVEYRTGKIEDSDPSINQTTQQQFAIYRGQQDGRGAIRSFFKRQAVDNHGDRFIANADQCFVGGASAGAALAMGLAYYRNQSMLNVAFPEATTSDLTIKEALGTVTENYYYGESGAGYFPTIRAALICWGGILIPASYDDGDDLGVSESGFFATTDTTANPPVISFAGADDAVVNYYDDESQYIFYSKINPGKKENFCLKDGVSGTYKIKKQVGDPVPIYTKQCSTRNIYNMLKTANLNRLAEHYLDCSMGHGLDEAGGNFGIDISGGIEAVQRYIAQRGAVFFQSVMLYNDANSGNHPPFGYTGHSFFSGCVNDRKCSDTGTNPCGTDDITAC